MVSHSRLFPSVSLALLYHLHLHVSFILQEQPLISFHKRNIWAVQRSANQVYVEHSCGKSTTVHADISITNLSLTELNFIVSNGRTIVTYKISKDSELSDTDKSLSIKLLQNFGAECLSLYIHDQNIICLTTNDVKIYSLGGVILKEILCNDNEGKFCLTYMGIHTINVSSSYGLAISIRSPTNPSYSA